jgi:hypothetical protein
LFSKDGGRRGSTAESGLHSVLEETREGKGKEIPTKIDYKKNHIEIVCTSKGAFEMKKKLNSINFSTCTNTESQTRHISPNMVFSPAKTKKQIRMEK